VKPAYYSIQIWLDGFWSHVLLCPMILNTPVNFLVFGVSLCVR